MTPTTNSIGQSNIIDCQANIKRYAEEMKRQEEERFKILTQQKENWDVVLPILTKIKQGETIEVQEGKKALKRLDHLPIDETTRLIFKQRIQKVISLIEHPNHLSISISNEIKRSNSNITPSQESVRPVIDDTTPLIDIDQDKENSFCCTIIYKQVLLNLSSIEIFNVRHLFIRGFYFLIHHLMIQY